MPSSMIVSLAPETKLERLACEKRCEAATVEAIRRGLADMAAGRVVPHDVVMAEALAIIEAAEALPRP